jgi:hypothetical protein
MTVGTNSMSDIFLQGSVLVALVFKPLMSHDTALYRLDTSCCWVDRDLLETTVCDLCPCSMTICTRTFLCHRYNSSLGDKNVDLSLLQPLSLPSYTLKKFGIRPILLKACT